MLEDKYIVDAIIREKQSLKYLQGFFSDDLADSYLCKTDDRCKRVLIFDVPPLVKTIWTPYGYIARFGHNDLYLDEKTPLNMDNLRDYGHYRWRILCDIEEYRECRAYVVSTDKTPQWSNHKYNRMCKLGRRIRKRISICEKFLNDCFADACNYIIKIKGV